MKAGLILFLTMIVLAATDSMAGGSVDCSNPYILSKRDFKLCTDGPGYDNGHGGYNNGSGYNDAPVYNDGDYIDEGYGDGGYGDDGGYYEEPSYDNRYSYIYGQNYGTCSFSDPHSYACTHSTFLGQLKGANPKDPTDFTLLVIDLKALSGDWETVTYVNPEGNFGNEFFMQTNPRSPVQPFGVYNRNPDSRVGSMWIRNGRMEFANWQGQHLSTSRAERIDEGTVSFTMREDQFVHRFTCRDFSRSGKHHFLCSWDVIVAGESTDWSHHGYIGFLSRRDWNDFKRNGIR